MGEIYGGYLGLSFAAAPTAADFLKLAEVSVPNDPLWLDLRNKLIRENLHVFASKNPSREELLQINGIVKPFTDKDERTLLEPLLRRLENTDYGLAQKLRRLAYKNPYLGLGDANPFYFAVLLARPEFSSAEEMTDFYNSMISQVRGLQANLPAEINDELKKDFEVDEVLGGTKTTDYSANVVVQQLGNLLLQHMEAFKGQFLSLKPDAAMARVWIEAVVSACDLAGIDQIPQKIKESIGVLSAEVFRSMSLAEDVLTFLEFSREDAVLNTNPSLGADVEGLRKDILWQNAGLFTSKEPTFQNLSEYYSLMFPRGDMVKLGNMMKLVEKQDSGKNSPAVINFIRFIELVGEDLGVRAESLGFFGRHLVSGLLQRGLKVSKEDLRVLRSFYGPEFAPFFKTKAAANGLIEVKPRWFVRLARSCDKLLEGFVLFHIP